MCRKFNCVNCGRNGHDSRKCKDPITSYGVINFDIIGCNREKIIIKDKFIKKKNTQYKIVSKLHSDICCFVSDVFKNNEIMYRATNSILSYGNEFQLKNFCYYRDKVLFMMVSRKFSIGFTEFVRGKYDVRNPYSIIKLFKQMYSDEISFVEKNKHCYDNLLYLFSNRSNQSREIVLNNIYEGKFSNEYCEAKTKFNLLKNKNINNDDTIMYDLSFYTKNIKPKWEGLEWGFPKGRLNNHLEEKFACACREFEEETGYKNTDYNILDKIESIDEVMTGTNGIKYKHIYYISINNRGIYETVNGYDAGEIGEIRWFTYEEAIKAIRPYHIEKKSILTQLYLFIMNQLMQ